MRFLSLAKLAASSLLLASTLGLLWHGRAGGEYWGTNYFANEFGLAQIPAWITDFLGGWFPQFGTRIYRVFPHIPGKSYLFILVSSLCILALFAFPFIRNRVLRWIVSIPLLAVITYELTIFDISGAMPDASTTVTMMINWRFGMEGTVLAYTSEILRNVLFVGVLAVPILWQPQLDKGWVSFAPSILVVSMIAVVLAMQQFFRPSQWSLLYPSPVQTIIDATTSYDVKPEVAISPASYDGRLSPGLEKIVVIMDESIRGDYLTLNNPGLPTTPFLNSMSDSISNFGIASSAANCSIPSRRTFRHLLRENESNKPIGPELLSRPTIWQFAHLAGYRTVHIDAFGTPVTLTSLMTQVERQFIDERITVRDNPFAVRDTVVAKTLRSVLQRPGKEFIFVEKFGSHVPYSGVYPSSQNPFQADFSKSFNLTDQDQLHRHYSNAVRWTVDAFFKELLAQGLPTKTTIFYTADHGQSLSEGGIRLSHCSFAGAMRMGEAVVPMFAITNDVQWKNELDHAVGPNFDRTSQYNLPTTALAMMGFDRSWIRTEFDPLLTDRIPPDHKRMVRFGKTVVEFDSSKLPPRTQMGKQDRLPQKSGL